MLIFRLALERHIRDLSGAGARLSGGRWNHKGTPVIYTSSSRALAALEYLVHVPISMVPDGLCMAIVELPNTASIQDLKTSDLPGNWRHYPAPPELANIGSEWASGKKTLLLSVPSAVIEKENNILLNPVHPQMHMVKISNIEPYIFDMRFFR